MLAKLFSIFKVGKNLLSTAEPDHSHWDDAEDALGKHALFLQLLDIFKNPNVIEVYLNSFGYLTYLTNLGHIEKSGVNYTADALMNLVWCLSWTSKTRLDPYRPYGGGVLPNFNLRWHVVLPPMSPDGPHVVFRRQQLFQASLSDFVLENFSRADLLAWVQEGASVVFYGATGSG